MSDLGTKSTVPGKAGAKGRDPAQLSTLVDLGPVAQVTPEVDVAQLLREIRRPIAERLQNQGSIGAGGMGAVEVAIDAALRRRMAKKVIHPRLSESARALFLFVREARITSQLDHPNIVPIHHLGEDQEGKLYFTMKLVSWRPS